MVLCMEGEVRVEGGLLWCCSWGDGGRSVVVLFVVGEGGLLGCCAWWGREVCCGVARGGLREVCCGDVFGGGGEGRGRSVVVLHVGGWKEVCCGVVRGERRGLEISLLW